MNGHTTERTPLLRSAADREVEAGGNGQETPVSQWRRTLGIMLALVGVFVAGADQSFLMVTYEVIASQFDDVSDSAWVLTGYNLGYCIALPVYGKMSDSYGRKIPLAVSYCLFSIGCLISGTGVLLWQIIVGRIITGLGGAGMVALISVIITDNVLPSQVALARSYVNVFNVSGRAFGGPLGAFITDAVGWRWSFIVQAPTALLCCVCCMVFLTTQQSGGKTSEQAQSQPVSKKIDYLGVITFTITISSLLASIEFLARGRSQSLVLLGVTFFFGLVFLLIEAYHAKEPLIPLSLLKTSSAFYFVIQMLLLFGRQAHVSSLSPYFLWTKDFKTTQAAIHLIPSPIGFTVGSIIGGLVIRKTNNYKSLCIGSIAFGASMYLLITIRWSADKQLPWEWLYILPAGLSLGAVLACTFTGLTVCTEQSLQATTICMYYLSQQVGGIIGTGVSSVALHAIFKDTLISLLRDVPNKAEVIKNILNKFGSLGVPEMFRVAVHSSYLHSFHYVSLIPVFATALALPLMLMIPKAALK
ncbi:hypothetical protein NUU61_005133 [Penicillium alfredii]|uniref:Major facilitator superfamily (MFS) profile domain-containing protein n=1 Tax=Penicillium alfredii TaxID=1506179 RepID=A0A9W9K898_9EURO|nr:uncharacterized protein NUU61_005133 [Penicillium alfredii]KAJ5095777.1 hypothetical protein NUU61_005133 [Penicillium alfredii]